MRIVVLGAGGQVGTEVTLRLARVPGVQVVPVIRTRSGSAFLRHRGVPVVHGDIVDPTFGARCLAGADVIANFALAGGAPSQARQRNDALAVAAFQHASRDNSLVFFSTLAVHGDFDLSGRKTRTPYGDLKRRNEALIRSLAHRSASKTYVLRLGHVAGAMQPLSDVCRDEILAPPIVLPDPDRASNVAHVVTIVDALLTIGAGRAGSAGRYDLVNVPQWSWRQVYEVEAAELGVTPQFDAIGTARDAVALSTKVKDGVLALVVRDRAKSLSLKLLHRLPGSVDGRVRANYYAERARREIAALTPAAQIRNPATRWPPFRVRSLLGLTETGQLLATGRFGIAPAGVGDSWPPDLSLPWASS